MLSSMRQILTGMSLRCVGNVKRSVIVKANEFVKKFGWDVATKLSKEMKGITESVADGVAGWGQSEWDKLKRLVESHELVKDYYGLTRAKEHAESNYTAPELKAALKQAIADVESCQ